MPHGPTGSVKGDNALQRINDGEAGRSGLTWLSGKNALVIDDEPFALERMVGILRRLAGPRLDISTAGSFEGALEVCCEHGGAFAVVLVNHRLWPGDEDGIALLGELRRYGLDTSARTVLYSVTMSRQLRQRALAAGFDDTLLTEEFDIGAVQALVELPGYLRPRRA